VSGIEDFGGCGVALADDFLETARIAKCVSKRSITNQPQRAALVTQISGML
jgi:hypothetical protein